VGSDSARLAAVLDDDAQLAALLTQVHRDFAVVEPSRLAH